MEPKQSNPARGIKPLGLPYQGTSSGIGLGIALTRHGNKIK
jgi:hypothetical protein